jgi:hypothetical protein
MTKTKTYTIVWRIDVEADTPAHAAEAALAIQRDPTSLATVFDVRDTKAHKTYRSVFVAPPGTRLKPTDDDMKHARLFLEQIRRLREIGGVAGTSTEENEIFFIACTLRNERDAALIRKEIKQ